MSKQKKSITKLLAAITAGAYALSAGQGSAKVTIEDTSKAPEHDVWDTIKRISDSSQTGSLRIQLASEAGKSELVSAVAQGLMNCSDDVETCVRQAIGRTGGLSNANLLSLASLSNSLAALGISPVMISQALDAYSTVVAEAIVGGVISEQFAAFTLSEEASAALYL